jgi:hypothetical protein
MNAIIKQIACFSLATVPVLVAASCGNNRRADEQVPVILVSDLYYPAQDIGDNVDLVAPFALKEIDLVAIIFDITRSHLKEDGISRDPGFIPVRQLNTIFEKEVPCAAAPYDELSSPEDRKEEAPYSQQRGIELFLQTLEKASRPVHIVSTGSLRPIAIALNRRPDLFHSGKVAAIHICAGSSSEDYLEWNIALDTLAAARVLRSDMRVILYPCASAEGPFDKDVNNTFWALQDLSWILSLQDRRIKNYLAYNILRKTDRPDFLSYLDEELPEQDAAALRDFRSDRFYGSGGAHYVWETALWMQLASLMLVERDGKGQIVRKDEVLTSDDVCLEELWPVTLTVKDNGLFSFERCTGGSAVWLYYRADPKKQETLLNQAFPLWYDSFTKDLVKQNPEHCLCYVIN